MGLSRASFAKLSPYPYLLANLEPSDDTVVPARSNGRAPDEARPPAANLSSLTYTQGSAVVRMGDTTAICGVRGEIILTRDIPNYNSANVETELSDYNLIVPNVDLMTGCAPQFLPGGPPCVLQQTLSSRIYSLLNSSSLIEPDQLRIRHEPSEADEDQPMDHDVEVAVETNDQRVAAYWVLFIDVVFISFDGNAFDTAWAAVLAALGDTKLPRATYDADKEQVFCTRKDPRPLTMTGMPVACTVAVFTGRETDRPTIGKHWLLIDPDMMEESLCDESATIVVDCTDGGEMRILSLSKHGGIVLSPKALQSEVFLGWAKRRWKEVVAAITAQPARYSTAVDTGGQIDLPLENEFHSSAPETLFPMPTHHFYPWRLGPKPSCPSSNVASPSHSHGFPRGNALGRHYQRHRPPAIASGIVSLGNSHLVETHPRLTSRALSRSGKAILHVDANGYYGAADAALSLDEADEWAEKHQSQDADAAFSAARVVSSRDEGGLSPARAYSLALAPQLIHARSPLLAQLVSSRAYRQLEFLAVGSLYLFRPSSDGSSSPTLRRVPSTREDLFADTVIPPRSKRRLIKFLKFVVKYDAEPQTDLWKPKAEGPLTEFLESEFGLDSELVPFVVILTLSLDANISVEAGLAAIHRHLTSMGTLGSGFAAVYPKWGGMSELAQVGCRAGAVGGAVYVLGTGVSKLHPQTSSEEADIEVTLSGGVTVKAGALIEGCCRSSEPTAGFSIHIRADLVGFPPGSIVASDGTISATPTFAMMHSSDTGECPVGQCVIYLSTTSNPASQLVLETALESLLRSLSADEKPPPQRLYQLSYEQAAGPGSFSVRGRVGTFALPPVDLLTFHDDVLRSVRDAWQYVIAADGDEEEYMVFEDRQHVADEDDPPTVWVNAIWFSLPALLPILSLPQKKITKPNRVPAISPPSSIPQAPMSGAGKCISP
ncbi:hypothetical protein L249_4648 [Ophiocordyceps polyrhachis-furcata BCC 54312]|uniref:Uncharacterized protein n=1 Tax=Ophiocordyceps polyrhachis-furcata BCC 54312 TaxID=1330021 RepID=A0A367L2K7_9HYPO|nr:hypothetical protein L249_4648 [Ophiocordyceps polyrhachis-furcata BCC 54312]